jgi:hypothetical protein
MVCSICKCSGHNKRTCEKTRESKNEDTYKKSGEKTRESKNEDTYKKTDEKTRESKNEDTYKKSDEKTRESKNETYKKSAKNKTDVSDILTFFESYKKSDNDCANKIREKVIKELDNPPKHYFENATYGEKWTHLHNRYMDALKSLARGIEYTSIQTKRMAGRQNNYDFDLMYYNDGVLVNTLKIEFKSGCSKISKLPQILTVSTKTCDFMPYSYEKFWYDERYLDRYIACDPEITEEKPSPEEYYKKISSTTTNPTPFFGQLYKCDYKKCDELCCKYNCKNEKCQSNKKCKNEKSKIVNESIAAYLAKYGKDIYIDVIKEKLKHSQADKIFLMWSNKTQDFSIDKFLESEFTNIRYYSIKNGNVIQLQAGTTMYDLLVRWKNRKGILNPAWQISMKRQV